MLNLTKSEQKAILFVAVILLLSVLIQWIRPGMKNSKPFDYTLQDSLFKTLSADTIPVKTDSVKPASLKKKIKKKKETPQLLKINVNRATKQELIRLPGVGSVTAQRIIDYRMENGPFKSINELIHVKRIGPKTLEKIKPYIYINDVRVDTSQVNDLKEKKR